jgi:hypothetical protein
VRLPAEADNSNNRTAPHRTAPALRLPAEADNSNKRGAPTCRREILD